MGIFIKRWCIWHNKYLRFFIEDDSYSVRNSMLTSCATPSSAIVSACPLPVECIAFSASIKNKTIVLNWKTASEIIMLIL